MAIEKGKILAFLGLIGGAFLMFSSFAGSKTEAPAGEEPGTPGTGIEDDPTLTDPTAESTVLAIGSKYNIQKFMFDLRENSNMITLVMQTPGIIKKDWYCEIQLPLEWSGSSIFNGKYKIRDVYTSNGIEYVQTSKALPKTVQSATFIKFVNSQFGGGLAKLIIVNWQAPATPVINYNFPSLPILRTVAAYTSNNTPRLGYTFIVVRDQNYLLNTVKYGDLVKLDQTVNAAYNNKTVRVESVRERNPTTSERIIEVELAYQGANSGGQLLLINN